MMTDKDKTVVNGIPVTSVPRTLIDLARILNAHDLELALEDALCRHLVTVEWIWKRLRILRGKGRHGIAALDRLLDERDRDHELTDSALEMRVLQTIREAGLPEPICHYNVVDGPYFIGEVDFA
jgi:hypothetical protein